VNSAATFFKGLKKDFLINVYHVQPSTTRFLSFVKAEQVFVTGLGLGGHLTLEEVANKFSNGKASAHKILHEHLGMSKVSARLVPRQLSADQKATRITNAKENLSRFNRKRDNFEPHYHWR
jgi:hypothetical protein